MLPQPPPMNLSVKSIPDPRQPLPYYLTQCIGRDLLPSETFYHYFNVHRLAFGGFKFFMNRGGSELIGQLATEQGLDWLKKGDNLRDFFQYLVSIAR